MQGIRGPRILVGNYVEVQQYAKLFGNYQAFEFPAVARYRSSISDDTFVSTLLCNINYPSTFK